jgi:hypothetical protein
VDYLLFEKPLADGGGPICLDLLAPVFEDPRIKVDKPTMAGRIRRVGPADQKSSAPDQRLHAFATPEAFAVHERPQSLPLGGRTPSGVEFTGQVRVPHPFASLCMKVKAAADFERASPSERKPRGARHAQDVYLLMAMLSEQEVDECHALYRQFREHPQLRLICEAVIELFGDHDGSGCRTIATNNRAADLQRFSAVINELFLGAHNSL